MKKWIRKFYFRKLLTIIEAGSESELTDIITAAIKRYESMQPDWDICYLALPKNDPKLRMQILEQTMLQLSSDHLPA